MFEIGKVYYINQNYRVDRRYAFLCSCYLYGVPADRIERFPARVENTEMPRTVVEIAQMILDDGFESFEVLTDPGYVHGLLDSDNEFHALGLLHPTSLASVWSKLALLRTIAVGQENVAFVTDSHYFLGNPVIDSFSTLERVCDALPDFRFLRICGSNTQISDYSEFEESGVDGILKLHRGSAGFCAMVLTPDVAREIFLFWNRRMREDKYPLRPFGILPTMWEFGLDRTGYYLCFPLHPIHSFKGAVGYDFCEMDKLDDTYFRGEDRVQLDSVTIETGKEKCV